MKLDLTQGKELDSKVKAIFNIPRIIAGNEDEVNNLDITFCSIIIVSSIAGLQGVENLGAYSISKTADLGLVRSLAVEWGGKGVRVNASHLMRHSRGTLAGTKSSSGR